MIEGGLGIAWYEDGDPEEELGIYISMDMKELIHVLATEIVQLKKRVAELEGDE